MDTFEVAVNKLEHFTQACLPTDHPLFVQVGTHNQFTVSETISASWANVVIAGLLDTLGSTFCSPPNCHPACFADTLLLYR